jgi:hypothetical protein
MMYNYSLIESIKETSGCILRTDVEREVDFPSSAVIKGQGVLKN